MNRSRCLVLAALLGIWRLSSVAQTFTEFQLPKTASGPVAIVPGPDGALWFTEYYGSAIGRCTLTGEITEFPLPNRAPWGIAAGPDGNIWFTESGFAGLGRLTPAGVLTEFPLSDPDSSPDEIVVGPDGALWFTESAGRIGRMSTDGALKEFTVFSVPTGLSGITVGPDGRLWFIETGAHKIASMTTDGTIVEYPVPGTFLPREITAGPDGALWFTDVGVGMIFRVSLSGQTSHIALQDVAKAPLGIVAGPDGYLWVAEAGWSLPPETRAFIVPGAIARVSVNGSVLEFPVPNPTAQPVGIAFGSDGNIWFTQFAGNSIVRLSDVNSQPRRPLARDVPFR